MIQKLKNAYHFLLSWIGNIIYWFPSKRIVVIGITGTKGKSTVVELINAIFESAGKKTAVISSVRIKVGDETRKNVASMTMPGRFFIKSFLRRAVTAGCEYAIIEVTSQGVLQHRHRFIDFDAALFTNLAPEHIEAHGSFENYRDAKVLFFEHVARESKKVKKIFFVNDASPHKHYFLRAVNGSGAVRYFSREAFIENELSGRPESIGDWLSSNFNLENAAAAAAVAIAFGVEWPVVQRALMSFKGVPGRLEAIQWEPFAVIVDYAHTPDALEAVYQAIKEKMRKRSRFNKQKEPRLICVLGAAGGGRDKWKRPVMGTVADRHCEKIILTDEDSYDENPAEILNQIASGVRNIEADLKTKRVFKVLDRREAVKKAILAARPGDVVMITGKGSERWLHLAAGKKIPWSDKMIAEEVLKSK